MPALRLVKVYPLTTRNGTGNARTAAKAGAYRFSDIAGTIFENTNKDLREWFRVIHLMLTSKKGISALQVQRMMGFGSYKTAWYMCHRIRAALAGQRVPEAHGHCRGRRDVHRRQTQQPA